MTAARPIDRSRLHSAWKAEIEAARQSRARNDAQSEWTHLERAHILSQPLAKEHVRTHAEMLGAAVRRKDVREMVGQVFRLAVAGPASLAGKYPAGNTGGANVSAFTPMPVPDDLRAVLGEEVPATFSTDATGLPAVTNTNVVNVAPGATYDLRISAVSNVVAGNTVRMLAYNGSIPGPTLRVQQGSEIFVRVLNDGDHETTVHWHGLRLDNDFDGVPFDTQAPIPVGGEFTYRLKFPDAGLYWYHPHMREDYGLELGLYGNIVVDPLDADMWPPADRDVIVTLDDVLMEDGRIAPFSHAGPTHVAMGRYGNVMLISGREQVSVDARTGEVVRLYFTNTANTRLFNVAVPGARMKLIGGDSGRVEHEQFVDEVLLAPSERAIVDIMFDAAGSYPLEHRTPGHTYTLGTVTVVDAPASAARSRFDALRNDPELAAERAQLDAALSRAPDKTLRFMSHMVMDHGGGHEHHHDGHHEHHHEHHGEHGGEAMMAQTSDGLEWEDHMAAMNAATTPENMVWSLVDADTGKENHDIDWAFRVGDRVKIRLVNDMAQDHPMHHPFHIHGAGRFLVLSRNGVTEPNLAWKDTVLIRADETVDILFDVTNPGRWMAHCHIAEHNQGGMMFSFSVDEAAERR